MENPQFDVESKKSIWFWHQSTCKTEIFGWKLFMPKMSELHRIGGNHMRWFQRCKNQTNRTTPDRDRAIFSSIRSWAKNSSFSIGRYPISSIRAALESAHLIPPRDMSDGHVNQNLASVGNRSCCLDPTDVKFWLTCSFDITPGVSDNGDSNDAGFDEIGRVPTEIDIDLHNLADLVASRLDDIRSRRIWRCWNRHSWLPPV